MPTDVSSVTKHFPSAENGFTTTLSGTISSGATTVGLNSVAGYSNGEVAVFVVDPSDAAKKQAFTGTVDTSGVQITDVVWTTGTNQTHTAGSTVVDYATATHISMVSKGLLVAHDQTGVHKSGATYAAPVFSGTATGTYTLAGTPTITSPTITTPTFRTYDGYIGTADTWTYASATTFTIAGVDRTSQFPVGTKIKLTQTTAKYFYVTAAAFGTDTTVTVTGGSDYTLANAAITSPFYSYDATPQGFPGEFAFTPTYTNLTVGAGTNTGYFSMRGKNVRYRGYWKFGAGAAVGSNPVATLPVAAASTYDVTTAIHPIGQVRVLDSGIANHHAIATISGTSTVSSFQFLTMQTDALYATMGGFNSTTPMTWATNDEINWSVEYTAA